MKVITMDKAKRTQMTDPCNTGECFRQGITDGLSKTLRSGMCGMGELHFSC